MDGGALFFLLIPLGIGLAILFRVLAGNLDHDRLREYVEQRGGTVSSIGWAPFGPGWWGEKSDRIYEVHYTNRDGNLHHSYAKTSMMTGVYFTEDSIVTYAKLSIEAREVETLEDENARLPMEIERLKREKGDDGSDAIRE
ncbi:MAG: hypothetical protein EXS16_12085 [Gemmataceae bacterium]|nr:hypothetical protein [Gemmataceae bacterium]